MLLIKIIKDEDGAIIKNPKWCATINIDAIRTLCSGQACGFGESNVIFEEKTIGKVTCPLCIHELKVLKQYTY